MPILTLFSGSATTDTTVYGLVGLDELRDYLEYDPADHADDAELARFARAASEIVEELHGITAPVQIVEQHDGGGASIVLLERRVVSIQSVVEYVSQTAFPLTAEPLGGATSAYGYTVDGPIITRRMSGNAVLFAQGRRNVIVSYTAGYATIPQRLKDAVCELARHWQRWGQEATGPSPSGDDAPSTSALGYAIPNRVLTMIEPRGAIVPGIG